MSKSLYLAIFIFKFFIFPASFPYHYARGESIDSLISSQETRQSYLRSWNENTLKIRQNILQRLDQYIESAQSPEDWQSLTVAQVHKACAQPTALNNIEEHHEVSNLIQYPYINRIFNYIHSSVDSLSKKSENGSRYCWAVVRHYIGHEYGSQTPDFHEYFNAVTEVDICMYLSESRVFPDDRDSMHTPLNIRNILTDPIVREALSSQCQNGPDLPKSRFTASDIDSNASIARSKYRRLDASAEICQSKMSEYCKLSDPHNYKDNIKCMFSNINNLKNYCDENIVSAYLSIIYSACDKDILSGTCLNSAGNSFDMMSCLMTSYGTISPICHNTIESMIGLNIPCAVDSNTYCLDAAGIGDFLTCMGDQDETKISQICLIVVEGYDRCKYPMTYDDDDASGVEEGTEEEVEPTNDESTDGKDSPENADDDDNEGDIEGDTSHEDETVDDDEEDHKQSNKSNSVEEETDDNEPDDVYGEEEETDDELYHEEEEEEDLYDDTVDEGNEQDGNETNQNYGEKNEGDQNDGEVDEEGDQNEYQYADDPEQEEEDAGYDYDDQDDENGDNPTDNDGRRITERAKVTILRTLADSPVPKLKKCWAKLSLMEDDDSKSVSHSGSNKGGSKGSRSRTERPSSISILSICKFILSIESFCVPYCVSLFLVVYLLFFSILVSIGAVYVFRRLKTQSDGRGRYLKASTVDVDVNDDSFVDSEELIQTGLMEKSDDGSKVPSFAMRRFNQSKLDQKQHTPSPTSAYAFDNPFASKSKGFNDGLTTSYDELDEPRLDYDSDNDEEADGNLDYQEL